MILDRWENLEQYAPLVPHLHEALAFCRGAMQLPAGRYAFDGGFVMIQEGTTVGPASEGDFEAHRTYIDIQVLLEGAEVVSWADIAALENVRPYQPDAWFFRGRAAADIPLAPGMACILFPHDGHKACRHLQTPSHYRKFVIKCPVEG